MAAAAPLQAGAPRSASARRRYSRPKARRSLSPITKSHCFPRTCMQQSDAAWARRIATWPYFWSTAPKCCSASGPATERTSTPPAAGSSPSRGTPLSSSRALPTSELQRPGQLPSMSSIICTAASVRCRAGPTSTRVRNLHSHFRRLKATLAAGSNASRFTFTFLRGSLVRPPPWVHFTVTASPSALSTTASKGSSPYFCDFASTGVPRSRGGLSSSP
mmetsp:Transcript_96959/g.274587  ORF Transcript_96959/g.274587 Transcript_96959/m.274587 type:complete len:218 (+) Transcript_96959:456-1109(+)